MKHFKQEDWADFARGLAGKRETAMRDHLQECDECRSAAQLWQQIAEMASQEAVFAPPESAVRIAKSYAAGTEQEKRSLATLVGELIFDSLREPSLAGVRSSATASPRQMLYRSGDYEIDLRIERELGSEAVSVIGQLLSKAGKSVAGLPVALIGGVGKEATGATNSFGEFQLGFVPRGRVSVCIWLYGASSNLLIPLDMEQARSAEPARSDEARGSR